MSELIPLNVEPMPLKLKVSDYLALDAAGALDDYAKTELIEGELFFINAQHRPHARFKSRLFLAISQGLVEGGSTLEALVEASVEIPDHGAPEPDIIITSEPGGSGLVPVQSVALAIEVSDASLTQDMGVKARLYAKAGIPEYWVADIEARVLHQLWGPSDGGYTERRELAFGEPVETMGAPRLRLTLRHD